MTETEILRKRLEACIIPEIKALTPGSLENYGSKELLALLRKSNAARNRGELNEQFCEWIIANEERYFDKIRKILPKCGNHKIRLAYYGIVYNILKYSGCYIIGAKNSPISISMSKFCSILCLDKRISNNARKTLNEEHSYYHYNFMVNIELRANGDCPTKVPELRELEIIANEIRDEIDNKFIR